MKLVLLSSSISFLGSLSNNHSSVPNFHKQTGSSYSLRSIRSPSFLVDFDRRVPAPQLYTYLQEKAPKNPIRDINNFDSAFSSEEFETGLLLSIST